MGFFFEGEYFGILSILCLIGCTIWFPVGLLLSKEIEEMIAHINNTLECKIKRPSKARLIFSYVFNVVEIILCIVSFFI